MSTLPIVVYAASGYTGRLTCQALARLGLPFVAAGRDQGRLEAVAAELRAAGADCRVQVAAHTPAGLRELFRGAEVVINTSGPFSLLGHTVVAAALASGCHYVDTTGEQDFMLELCRDHDAAFACRGRVLAPSAAFLWALGCTGAELCLEHPGIEEIEAIYAPPSLQTVASLQSMVRTARRPGIAIAGGEPTEVRLSAPRRVDLPDAGGPRRAVEIGAGEAAFLTGDRRVRACRTLFASDDLARVAPAFRLWSRLSRVVPGSVLDRCSDFLVGAIKRDPPAEEPDSGRFVVSVHGRGPAGAVRATLRGTSPYLVTGFLCAMTAQDLLAGKALRSGYLSLAQAFGARHVIDRLVEVGTTATVEALPAAETRAA